MLKIFQSIIIKFWLQINTWYILKLIMKDISSLKSLKKTNEPFTIAKIAEVKFCRNFNK